MPELCLNMGALEHNFYLVSAKTREWDFSWLPVLKMTADFPPVKAFLHDHGLPATGTADIEDIWTGGAGGSDVPDEERESRCFINIVPPSRACDIVRRFARSYVSSPEGLAALDRACAETGLAHSVLLMADLGDGREGAPCGSAFTALLEHVRTSPPSRVRIDGIASTLGCLSGLCPSEESMERLFCAMREMDPVLARDEEEREAVVSLGGSIFWNWFAENHAGFNAALAALPGKTRWRLELRMGDPLLLGFDMYRGCPLLGGDFRRDLFSLEAEVLEIHTKSFLSAGPRAASGTGRHVNGDAAPRRQALLDCGHLHSDMSDVTPLLAGAKFVDASGNYSALDISDCPDSLVPGDRVSFHPGYWAVARAFRSRQVRKTVC